MVFCNIKVKGEKYIIQNVTILILIDGFLQFMTEKYKSKTFCSHNPYFNRWFSAMSDNSLFEIVIFSHNPYFNRWFSAILHYMT